MLAVSKQPPTADELAAWLSTVPGFLEGATQVDGRPVRLYDYQIDLMTCPQRFRAVLKSRQTGLSFGYAAEALAKAHLSYEYTAIFVSYNLDDAKEKIRHAAMLYESMPAQWQKRRVTDNKTELEFEDGQGRRSRLISLPCRDPRGKGKADVYLDELPFMQNARRIYTAAVPIISRGGGNLTLGSTPLGKQDLLYEILEGEAERYPHYARFRIPWWDCPDFCTDVPRAGLAAPDMTTDQRVATFGTETIQVIRASLDLENFQQEYECCFVDEAVAFIPWDLIVAGCRDETELEVAGSVQEFFEYEAQGPLYAGFDVGRRRNASELIVVERVGERFYVRLHQTLDKTRFSDQKVLLRALIETRRDLQRLCIDETGMGMQLAEELAEAFPGRVEPVTFTNPVKNALGNGLKIAFEDRNLAIPAKRELMQQIHSVRKTVTIAGNIRLDTDHDDKHHADQFWALALALHGADGESPLWWSL